MDLLHQQTVQPACSLFGMLDTTPSIDIDSDNLTLFWNLFFKKNNFSAEIQHP